MHKVIQFLIRSTSFLGKELATIFRQPRLITSLVIGPFLIMLIFGLGFQDQTRTLRTTFVIESESPFTKQIEDVAARMSSPILFQGIEHDKDVALAKLPLKMTDLVIVVPDNPEETIKNNQQAQFMIYHNEVDPFQTAYIQFIGSSISDLFNRELLQSITSQGQEKSKSIQTNLDTAVSDAKALREALEANNLTTASSKKEELGSNLNIIRLAIGSTLAVISDLENNSTGQSEVGSESNRLLQALEQINQTSNVINNLPLEADDTNLVDQADEVKNVELQLTSLKSNLTEFQSLSPEIIVSPFTSKTVSLTEVQFTPIGFLTPAVIALLLQHISITFAALSIVRERKSGIMELFRVAPLTAFETLVSKFISYLVFNMLLVGIITGLVFGFLGLPMLGTWQDYSFAVFILLFTSLSMGFLVSLISNTDTQAAQFSMLLLLASIFFSGFFLDLRLMWRPMSFIPWMLPATYGIRMFQDIMLRGYAIPLRVLQGLIVMGSVLFLLDWILLRKKMETT